MKKQNILQILSSPYLAAFLFIFLAIIIFLGTYIPQEPSVGQANLISRFGEEQYKLIKLLGFHDVFHAWWYIILLFILSINLSLASFLKVFPRSRKAFRWPEFLKTNPNLNNKKTAKQSLSDWTKFQESLKNNFWEIRLNPENNSLIARKGAFHRLGPSITHIGILTIMAGALISLLFGFNGIIQGSPEDRFILNEREDAKRSYILVESVKIFHADYWLGKSPNFEVEIDETERFNYPDNNNRPKQWTTDLSFYSTDGTFLNSQKMQVNKPIRFQNIDFYQADWKRLLKIVFNQQKFEINLDSLLDKELTFISVNKNLGLLFIISKSKLTLISVAGNLNSENLKKPSDFIKNNNLKTLASDLKPNESVKIGPMEIKFIGAYSQTGIQFKYSPGDTLMIIGMCILLLGVFIAFGAKRFIWAIKDESQNVFFIISKSDRLQKSFEQELSQLMKLA